MTEYKEVAMEYNVGSQHYRGVLLKNSAPAKAAVVLLPDWRGQSDLAREHASHLVELGCVVAIADLYGNGFSPERPDQVGAFVQQLIEHRSDGVKALGACMARLRQEVPAGTPTLCLGYSAGGMVALDYARSGADVDGTIVCSALLKTAVPGTSTKIGAPVLILQGTQDQISPMSTIAEVVAEMDQAGNDVTLVLYSQTHHAFDNPRAGTDPNARLVYSPTSARRARQAIAEFVRRCSEKRDT